MALGADGKIKLVEAGDNMIEEKGARKLAGDILGVSPRNILPGVVGPLEEMLSALTPREQLVLHLRYGLTDGKPRTLAEVAPLIEVTSRERPRRIQLKAMRRLRHPIRRKVLKQFIVDTPLNPVIKALTPP
jgi:hypothetical protein